jgi:ribonuclease HII
MDSKALTPEKRRCVYDDLMGSTVIFALGFSSHRMVDRINVFQATMRAMGLAIRGLKTRPDHVLIDGNKLPKMSGYSMEAIVGGDARNSSIAAASIIAKVRRDTILTQLDTRFSGYSFKRNKGYGTKSHLAGIQAYGLSDVHRRSFKTGKQLDLF